MTPEYRRDDRWWVSPFNVTDEVRRSFSLPPRVQIHDATLRDGEQTPGVVFTVADKVAIAEALGAVGVHRIEAGMPAVSDDDIAAIKQIVKLGLSSKIYTFVRAITADIDKSLECGADGVILEVPIGYPKLLWQFKWTWEDVLKKSVEVVRRSGDIVLGKKSGKASIAWALDQLRISGAGDEAVGEMLRLVKERSIANRALVSLEEFREIAERVLAHAESPA
jgi:isopropylmalate/homocitrate/citramalate synthase